MDKQSGSSSKSAQKAVDLSSLSLTDKRPCSSKKEAVNPSPLTDEKLCAYCGKIGDLKLKCEFCEQKSLPATYYCSVACKMDHRHDAQNPHICGAVRPALTDDEKLCAYCQKKKGIQKCEMCERMSCPPTLYCSDVCQKTDWSFHKHICGKSKLCPHCGKKAICTYLCNGLCGLSYCSFRCLMDDIKCHRHICGVSYPAKADPKNANLRTICCLYFPSNERVPKTEKNPKPRIFPLQIRLDVPGTPLTGFRFDGPMFCALMGSDLSCTLYNKCIFNKTGKVVPESCDQMSHHFLIVYRSNFKTDPSGVNRCLQNCTDGKMQTPWAGPVLVLKCTGEKHLDPASCVDVETGDFTEIMSFFYLRVEDCKEKIIYKKTEREWRTLPKSYPVDKMRQ